MRSRHHRELLMFLIATSLCGCAGTRGGPAAAAPTEDPLSVAARELRRQAWSEVERSRSAPEALDSAAALALAADHLMPGDPEPYRILAEARGRAGDDAGAIAALEEAARRAPENPDLQADLRVARAGVIPGTPRIPETPPPSALDTIKVSLRLAEKDHGYDDPIPGEVEIRNLGKEAVTFDALAGVDPVVQLQVLVDRKGERYDEYGSPEVSFRSLRSLAPGEAATRPVDLNTGSVAVALAAFAPHHPRVLAFRPSLMGARGQPWVVDGLDQIVRYHGIVLRSSVLADLEAQRFSQPLGERLHLVKLYGHLVSGAALPKPFAPRYEPFDYPRDTGRELIVRLLKDPEPLIRAAAAQAAIGLGADAGPEVLDLLAEMLSDQGHWLARGQAAYALAKLQGRQALSRLRTVANEDPELVVRQLAAAALLQIPAGEGE